MFATTNWSLVLAAGGAESAAARKALEALCEAYWPPLYAFIRRQGNSPEDAADLTQGYLVQLLEKGVLKDLRPEAGRFRSFLFVSVKHFLANERDRARALKRGGGRVPFSLAMDAAEERYRFEPIDTITPERLFERNWAKTVVERAMTRLEAEIAQTGDLPRFRRLRSYLMGDTSGSHRDVGEELGMTETAVGVAVHRMRRQFGRHLRDEIGETVADPSDVDPEIRHLLAVLDGG